MNGACYSRTDLSVKLLLGLIGYSQYCMNIVEQLKEAIRTCGLSQAELARRSGVPQPNISKFLLGKKDFALESAALICDALGLSLTHDGKKSKPMGSKP